MNKNKFIIVHTQRKAPDPIRTPKLSSLGMVSTVVGDRTFLLYKYKYINFINK